MAPQGTPPTPKAISFQPGHLLGSVSGALGLKKFLDERGVELIVTSDKDGDGCVLEQHLPTADVVISQPFWPAYLTPVRRATESHLQNPSLLFYSLKTRRHVLPFAGAYRVCAKAQAGHYRRRGVRPRGLGRGGAAQGGRFRGVWQQQRERRGGGGAPPPRGAACGVV